MALYEIFNLYVYFKVSYLHGKWCFVFLPQRLKKEKIFAAGMSESDSKY
jgi:hypothetical protein